MLQAGENYKNWGGYNTIEQAQNDGAVVLSCKRLVRVFTLPAPSHHFCPSQNIHKAPRADGVFLNKTMNFIGLGMALYGLASLYEYFSKDPIIKHTVKCRYCRKHVNEKVCCKIRARVGIAGCPIWIAASSGGNNLANVGNLGSPLRKLYIMAGEETA